MRSIDAANEILFLKFFPKGFFLNFIETLGISIVYSVRSIGIKILSVKALRGRRLLDAVIT
jgi:hypothetical protein